jgi:hypothetical protein
MLLIAVQLKKKHTIWVFRHAHTGLSAVPMKQNASKSGLRIRRPPRDRAKKIIQARYALYVSLWHATALCKLEKAPLIPSPFIHLFNF